MIQIEAPSTKEELVAVRNLLREATAELEYVQMQNPRLANSNISSILERARIALLRD